MNDSIVSIIMNNEDVTPMLGKIIELPEVELPVYPDWK